MKRRLFLTVLISAILAGGLPLSASAAGITDVPADAWYAPAVTYCLEEGLMNGDSPTTFHPQETMSRAMFYQALYNMTDHQPDRRGRKTFPLPGSASPMWTPQAGSPPPANGPTSLAWRRVWERTAWPPHQPIKREEMALLLYRYAMASGNDAPVEGAADVEGTSPWAQEAMAWAVEQGVLQGDSGGLRPQDTATRAEAAQVLQRVTPLLEKREVPRKPRLTETGTALGLTAETYPKVDGSTSTLALVQAAYEATHQYWAEDYPFAPSRTVPSYEKLIAGEVDLILVPSPLPGGAGAGESCRCRAGAAQDRPGGLGVHHPGGEPHREHHHGTGQGHLRGLCHPQLERSGRPGQGAGAPVPQQRQRQPIPAGTT